MSDAPQPPADSTRIRHYLAVVEHGVATCADYRGGRSDVFLWSARRVAEAILYALAEGTAEATSLQAQAHAKAGIRHGELLQRLVAVQRVPAHMAPYLEQLRVSGQLALSGPQAGQGKVPQEAADRATLDGCVRALPLVVRWLFAESAVARPMPEKLARDLHDLAAPTARVPQEYRVEKELAALREEAAKLRSDRAALRRQFGLDEVTGAPLDRPVVWGPKVWVAVALAGALGCGWLVGRWSAGPAAGPVPPPRVAAPPTAPPPPAAVDAVQASEALPAVVTAAVAVETTPTPTAEAPDAAADAPPPAPVPPPEPPAPAAAAEAGAVRSACPSGTVEVPADAISLGRGPYPRPEWPEAANRPPRLRPEAACLDAAAVQEQDFATWLQSAGKRSSPPYAERSWQDGKPLDRVTWLDAEAYCKQRGASLPSVAQWEAVARLAEPPLQSGLRAEWSAEAFPTATFGYGPAQVTRCNRPNLCSRVVHEGAIAQPRVPGPRLRWVHRTAGRTYAGVGFRCVQPLPTP